MTSETTAGHTPRNRQEVSITDRPDAATCPHCGGEIARCSICGHPVEPDAMVCDACWPESRCYRCGMEAHGIDARNGEPVCEQCARIGDQEAVHRV